MPYFKDPQNKLHFLDNPAFAHLLPAGSIEITKAEADVLRTPPPETLDVVKIRTINNLSTMCEAEIVSGFFSSALGSQHLYQSDRDDQLNLVGAVATAAAMPYKCQDSIGAWDYRLHTAAQLSQVLADGAAKKLAHLQRYMALKMQIEAATTIAEAEAVVW